MDRLEYKVLPTEFADAADQPGHFTGKASVYGIVDLGNDKVMPGAFSKSLAESGLEVPICNAHDRKDVIGLATLEDTPHALTVKDGFLELQLQSARDAHVRMKSRLLKGMSIGYRTVKAKSVAAVRELHEIKLWEVSLVSFPMLPAAQVASVKAMGDDLLADIRAGRLTDAVKDVLAGFGVNEATRLEAKIAEQSLSQRIDAIYAAVRAKFSESIAGSLYVRDCFDEYCLAVRGGQTWQIPYAVDAAGVVSLGEPIEGAMVFEPKGAGLQALLTGLKSLR